MTSVPPTTEQLALLDNDALEATLSSQADTIKALKSRKAPKTSAAFCQCIAGLFDYGPPGSALQSNILSLWRQHFVLEEDMLEIECTNLTPESVLKTSGHVDRFTDAMVKDTKTGDIFRADHLVKQILSRRLEDDRQLRTGVSVDAKKPKGANAKTVLDASTREHYDLVLETLDNYQGDDLAKLIKDLDIRAPETNNPVTEPVLFNLMFDTQIGPTGQFKGFMRPETAQGHFLNFKKLLEFNNEQMPFASASIGKSFRNEISPRQGCFVSDQKDHPRFGEVRDLEVLLYSSTAQLAAAGPTMTSIGSAVAQGTINNETLGYFVARIYLFLVRIGIDPSRWIESVGCADRSAYDLTAHSKRTGEKLVARHTLSEPIVRDALILEINKSKFGPAFKKNAKVVQGYFDALMLGSSDEWDEVKLAEIDKELKANNCVNIVGTDGNPYVVTADMLSITRKTIKINVREYTPSVIEPSFGIGRILYALLEHSYYVREGDEQRAVFKFQQQLRQSRHLLLPLVTMLALPLIKEIVASLRRNGVANKVDDSTGSIGRRYARNDELGTPFAITIDFQTVNDKTVTLRERDTTKQIRESIPVIVGIIRDLVEERMTWDEVLSKFTLFVSQETSS
ncbi:glycine-tRNA ligase [Batrachochytrium salamandrivorans]|nr:glycine-tRNA ligase [Batrachochytrium salamandrivorans]